MMRARVDEQPRLMRRGAWLLLGVAALAASCGFPPLSQLADAGSIDGEPPAITLELLAGDINGVGSVDGTGAAARFGFLGGLAVDTAGNVYLADSTSIRKVTPAGVVTRLAGIPGSVGSLDGTGADARFFVASSVAVDSAGNIYVADRNNHTIRKVTPNGAVTTLAGSALLTGSTDATGAAARFNQPSGVAIDGAGNVYVADTVNDTIRKVTPAGIVTTLAGMAGVAGSTDGMGPNARFFQPTGLVVDSAGTLYVADRNNHTIRKITSAGAVTTLAGSPGSTGTANGTGTDARFSGPSGVALDGAGNVIVADRNNHALRKVTTNGAVTTLVGIPGVAGSMDGSSAAAQFNFPAGVAVNSTGTIYVADSSNRTVRKVTSAGVVTTLAGTAPMVGSVDATGAAARFNFTGGVAVDSAGNVYTSDQNNNTIRKITPAGVVTTLAGTPGMSGSADGTGPEARFSSPFGVVTDGAGNVYVADDFNSTIRKISPAGVVSTFAGTPGMPGSANGTGAEARFSDPVGVVVDSAGTVYVADQFNHTIRKVTAAGVVTTLAGTPGKDGSTDGTGTEARFNVPVAVALDSAGNVYVADFDNHTIRKITPAGVVTTVAGAAGLEGSSDGVGTAARFRLPAGVAVDSAGNIYVDDFGNSTIRKITPAGVVTTIAGAPGIAGIVLGTSPRLASPQGIAISGDSIVIADANGVLMLRHAVP